MFVDRVQVEARGGDGGAGCMSFRREKFIPRGGPDGGNGGDGGSVILRVNKDTSDLRDLFYRPRLIAKTGGHGRGKQQHGKSAENLVVSVPPGTVVRRLPEQEKVTDLVNPGDEFILCAGGRGGRGNTVFRSSTHQAPREFDRGHPGETGRFEMELRIVADVGLVGFPNAGKSTLLSKLTRAHPKIAAYPFTTLHPVIGSVEYDDYKTLRIADVPGLVEGAHQDVGLGHDFLRHIERCHLLVILLDMAGTDGRDPRDDYRQLLGELKLYNVAITKKPRIVVANKMDRPESEARLREFKKRHRVKILPISAEQGAGLDALRKALHTACLTEPPGVRE